MKIVKSIPLILELLLFFSWEVVKANYEVMKCVLKSNASLQPRFFDYPLRLNSDTSVFWLSQMITLTPGTLSLHYEKNLKTLEVHCLHSPEITETISSIRVGFEDRLLKIEGALR
jgi:multisubunit Na+/H+ antiporter MnhE subunit